MTRPHCFARQADPRTSVWGRHGRDRRISSGIGSGLTARRDPVKPAWQANWGSRGASPLLSMERRGSGVRVPTSALHRAGYLARTIRNFTTWGAVRPPVLSVAVAV